MKTTSNLCINKKKRLLTILAFASLMLTACFPQWIQPEEQFSSCYGPKREFSGVLSPLKLPIPSDARIMQNEGTICFTAIESNKRLQAQVSSSGCFSSSCTLTYERNGNMQVDVKNHQLLFTTYFAATENTGNCICTGDCGGAGNLLYDIDKLPEGDYRVMLGDTELGKIQIPFPSSTICFSTD